MRTNASLCSRKYVKCLVKCLAELHQLERICNKGVISHFWVEAAQGGCKREKKNCSYSVCAPDGS